MHRITIALLLALSGLVTLASADSIQVEHGRIEISIERGEAPYKIGTASFDKASKAASFLGFLAKNWPNESRPTIVVNYRDKVLPEDNQLFEAVLSRMAAGSHWKVVRMPTPRGAIPETWFRLSKLHKKWAEDGADQPATALESKSEGKEKPKPESEGRSQ